MKVTRIIPVLLLAFLAPLYSSAQNFDKAFFAEHLNTKTYTLDTNAGAIILYEKGTVTIEKSKMLYHVHRIVKILRTTGFSLGTVKENYPARTDKPTATKNIRGTTYNIEDGKTTTAKLEKSAISNNKLNNNYTELSFIMPDVKTGSVIDYEYDIETAPHQVLPLWEFKNRVPKLVSEFEIIAPKQMEFTELGMPLKAKYYESAKAAANENTHIYNYSRTDASNIYHNWGQRNISPLKPEPFVNNLDNFKEVLTMAVGKDDDRGELNAEWENLNDELWANEYFGKIATSTDRRIQALVDSITRNDRTPLAKAKTIFNYSRNSFDYNNNEGISSRRPIDQIFSNRIASEAEINLLMVAMMRMAKLNASPVIVSKLNTPPVSPYLPIAKQFNYTVALLIIDTTKYYMDGSNFFNAFGVLPIFCNNGYSRIVNESGSSVWLSGGDYKDQNVQTINVYNVTDSTYIAEVTDRKGRIEGNYLRNIIGGQDTTIFEKYLRKRCQPFGGTLTIITGEAENLYDPEKDLVLKYKIAIRRPTRSDLNISANIMKFFNNNPFVSTERTLPVEFPTKYAYSYTMTIKVPESMQPNFSSPPSIGEVPIKGLETNHDISYDKESHTITVKTILGINRNTFPVEEYGSLKFFFDQMVSQENTVIKLKSKAK